MTTQSPAPWGRIFASYECNLVGPGGMAVQDSLFTLIYTEQRMETFHASAKESAYLPPEGDQKPPTRDQRPVGRDEPSAASGLKR